MAHHRLARGGQHGPGLHLWNLSLRKLSALESAAINNTMLIQIAILAWIFLDEPLGPGEAAGIVLVSAGVLMTQTALIGLKRNLPSARTTRGLQR
jgi:drug/metabolite transporter (DMT)-like permease